MYCYVLIPFLLTAYFIYPLTEFRTSFFPSNFTGGSTFSVHLNFTVQAIESPGYLRRMFIKERAQYEMSCSTGQKSLLCVFRPKTQHRVFSPAASVWRTWLSDEDVENPSLDPYIGFDGITSISNGWFHVEFEETRTKISSQNKMSELTLGTVQRIADLLKLDVQLGDVIRAQAEAGECHSTVHWLTGSRDCPVRTRAHFQLEEKISNSKQPAEFFELTSRDSDKFDKICDNTTGWILEVNRTMDIKNCKNFDVVYYSFLSEHRPNITSVISNMKITNKKFESTAHTEGIITTRKMQFAAQDTITVSMTLDDLK